MMMSMTELRLGLAPPFSSSTESTSSSLDLNTYSFNCHVPEKKMKNKVIDTSSHDFSDGEGYGSSLSTQNTHDHYGSVEDDGDGENSSFMKKKRGFEEAFDDDCDHDALPRALPLLVWNKQPSDEDDNPENNCFAPNKIENGGDGDAIVGWPPISSYRRKLCRQNSYPRAANYAAAEDNYGGGAVGHGGAGSGSKLVKVQMEGVMITRKIDLSRHRSYETLTPSLCSMFGTGIDGYTLTYLDKEGDWLLAGDVPWRAFVRSVRRLKLLRRVGQSSTIVSSYGGGDGWMSVCSPFG